MLILENLCLWQTEQEDMAAHGAPELFVQGGLRRFHLPAAFYADEYHGVLPGKDSKPVLRGRKQHLRRRGPVAAQQKLRPLGPELLSYRKQ